MKSVYSAVRTGALYGAVWGWDLKGYINATFSLSKIKDGLKLNDTHQLLAYADDDNLLGGSVDTVKKSE